MLDWNYLLPLFTAIAGVMTAIIRYFRSGNLFKFSETPISPKQQPVLHARALKTRLTVHDNGNATICRSWNGVTTDRLVPVPFITEELSSPSYNLKFLASTDLEVLSPFPKWVQIQNARDFRRGRSVEIHVVGGIVRGDPLLSYQHTSQLERADKSLKNGDSLFSFESYVIDLTFPVDRLLIEVKMPAGASIEAFPIVFFQGTEHPDQEYLALVQREFRRQDTLAYLEVEHPQVGPRYGIYWTERLVKQAC